MQLIERLDVQSLQYYYFRISLCPFVREVDENGNNIGTGNAIYATNEPIGPGTHRLYYHDYETKEEIFVVFEILAPTNE